MTLRECRCEGHDSMSRWSAPSLPGWNRPSGLVRVPDSMKMLRLTQLSFQLPPGPWQFYTAMKYHPSHLGSPATLNMHQLYIGAPRNAQLAIHMLSATTDTSKSTLLQNKRNVSVSVVVLSPMLSNFKRLAVEEQWLASNRTASTSRNLHPCLGLAFLAQRRAHNSSRSRYRRHGSGVNWG
jgi:hypothetical protein